MKGRIALKRAASFQEILRQRERASFVGRQLWLDSFQANIKRSPHDPGKMFIFSISGQAGSGKSYLLNRLRADAEREGCTVAVGDETQTSLPQLMYHLAAQLESNGVRFDDFRKRYRVYMQKRKELESDPEAPRGLTKFFARNITKIAIGKAKSSMFQEYVKDMDSDELAESLHETMEFISKKVLSTDEITLIREPESVLTPLFISDLGELSTSGPIALFFDTYERTSSFLEQWLLDLFRGRYGDIPGNLVVTIAGQAQLSLDNWSSYEEVISRIPLESFSDEEATLFLAGKGITNPVVVRTIIELSGSLPLLLATLAAGNPQTPAHVGDPSDTAIDRFLRWVAHSERDPILAAALPRRIDSDVLSALVEGANGMELLDRLRMMPFLLKRQDGYRYHDLVRGQMLRHQKAVSPDRWSQRHGKLIAYFKSMRELLTGTSGSNSQPKALPASYELGGQSDSEVAISRLGFNSVQDVDREILYHRICEKPHRSDRIAAKAVLRHLSSSFEELRKTIEVVWEAEVDGLVPAERCIGSVLSSMVSSDREYPSQVVIDVCSLLLELSVLEDRERATLLVFRSVYRAGSKLSPELAVDDVNAALAIAPDLKEARTIRGIVHLLLGQAEEALIDLHAGFPGSLAEPALLVLLGEARASVGDVAGAIRDLEAAVEKDRSNALLLRRLGTLYRDFGNSQRAFEIFEQAHRIQQDDNDLMVLMASALIDVKKYVEAIDYLKRAEKAGCQAQVMYMCLAVAYANTGEIAEVERYCVLSVEKDQYNFAVVKLLVNCLRHRGALDEAIDVVSDYIQKVPSNPDGYLERAGIYFSRSDFLSASCDLEVVCRMGGETAEVIETLACSLERMSRLDEAIALYDRLLSEGWSGDTSHWIHSRGLLLSWDGRYAQSVAVFEKLVAGDVGSLSCNYNLAIAVARWRGVDAASNYLSRAMALAQAKLGTDEGPSAHYGIAGINAVMGNTELAFIHLRKSIAAGSEAQHWAKHDQAWVDLRGNEELCVLLDETC